MLAALWLFILLLLILLVTISLLKNILGSYRWRR